MHDKLNLNLVYALSTRSLCQTKITQDAITTRAYRRVEVKFIAILLEFSFFFQCMRDDFDVCESTKIVSAKRPRCMRIDSYANRLVCETTGYPFSTGTKDTSKGVTTSRATSGGRRIDRNTTGQREKNLILHIETRHISCSYRKQQCCKAEMLTVHFAK